MVDAGDQPVGDGRCGAEHDDERDRPFGQLEQQDRQREPGDRRHRLQPGDHRADRRAGDLRRGHDPADDDADGDGESEPDDRPAHRHADGLGDRAVGDQLTSRSNTVAGAGSTYSGRHPDHTTICQSRRPRAMAATFGHVTNQMRRASSARPCPPPSVTVALSSRGATGMGRRRSRDQRRAWASASSRSWSVTVAASGSPRASRCAGPLDRDVETGRDPSRPGRHDDDAVGQPGGLADVVGDEQYGQTGARTSVSSSSCRASRVIASSAPNGSSISRMSASWANARPARHADACRPTAGGALLGEHLQVHRRQELLDASPAAAFGTPASRIGSSTLAATVSHGYSADSWNISAALPRTSIVPVVGVSSPATRSGSSISRTPKLDRHTNSPSATSRSTSRRAVRRGVSAERLVHTVRRESRHSPLTMDSPAPPGSR